MDQSEFRSTRKWTVIKDATLIGGLVAILVASIYVLHLPTTALIAALAVWLTGHTIWFLQRTGDRRGVLIDAAAYVVVLAFGFSIDHIPTWAMIAIFVALGALGCWLSWQLHKRQSTLEG